MERWKTDWTLEIRMLPLSVDRATGGDDNTNCDLEGSTGIRLIRPQHAIYAKIDSRRWKNDGRRARLDGARVLKISSEEAMACASIRIIYYMLGGRQARRVLVTTTSQSLFLSMSNSLFLFL